MKKIKYKILFILLVFVLVLPIFACSKKSYFSSNEVSDETKDLSEDKKSNNDIKKSNSDSNRCVVEVSGCVNKPGVYELGSDARIYEAIFAAGGLKDDADLNSLNQAQKVSDGQKIVILSKEEKLLLENAKTESDDGKININLADEKSLMTLPGVGESKAKAIIKYREANGGFKDKAELKNISGIKDGVYNKIEDSIKV